MKSKQIMYVKDITLKLTRFFAGFLVAADVDGRVKSSSSSSSSGSTSLSLVCNKRNKYCHTPFDNARFNVLKTTLINLLMHL